MRTESQTPSETQTGERLSNSALLDRVAKIAAWCCIDLESNLNTAHKEYMAGEIPKGAFEHVRSRHLALHTALENAGYTGKHPIFDIPQKPKTESQEQSNDKERDR